jgi:16S rRNA (uracil1498-N3)-methyltransferase
MAATRLFISDKLRSGAELGLGSEQARYISRALRLRSGDTLSVFNGEDGEFTASVTAVAQDSVVLQLQSHVATATESPLKVHLVQGISRGERMDIIFRKATELGVKRITPVLTDYSVVKLDAQRAARRRDHWQSIAESACEQSGRIRPPLVDPPISLNSWFGDRARETDTDLILQPGATAALASIARPATKVCLLIGPEGGFSDSEYEDAAAADFRAVALGPRVLRTETAALAALAVVQSLWGDLQNADRSA